MIDQSYFFNPKVDRRLNLLVALVALGFFVLSLRLFQLQVIRGKHMYRLAELNRTQIISLKAPRGLILDRHGEVLVDNAPRFSLFYSTQSVTGTTLQEVEQELVQWFPQENALVRKNFRQARKSGKMTRLVSGISREKALALMEKRLGLPGTNILAEPQRYTRYPTLASHLLGYVDEISRAELVQHQDKGYRMGQLLGKTGLENIYDQVLRGKDGGLQFEMDASGHHIRVMRRIHSQSGLDLVLTIDRSLQEALEEGLQNSPSGRGAGVVMDPQTGAVLALASFPSFDVSQNITPHLTDPSLPLFNRSIQGGYPLGSVFKIVTAAAGLLQDWDINQKFYCPGKFRLGRQEFACWKKHGSLNFLGAVAWSCNVYFYNMGLHVGVDPLTKMGEQFGLGRATNIDIPSESAGIIPSPQWKKKAKGDSWYRGDTVNFSIGQGDVIVTPLQVARMMSAVANGGRLWKPHLVQKVVDPREKTVRRVSSHLQGEVKLTDRVWSLLHEGLQMVVSEGTGRGVYRGDLVIGGKTGTAENPHGDDHAWFAAYAGLPGEDPSLVVVTFVENGGHGSSAAVPIARRVIGKAFPWGGRS